MQNIRTICPQCQTFYLVSAIHLSVAEGKVFCSKCKCSFNAYQHLDLQQTSYASENQIINKTSNNDIFKSKAANSNIDLQTYLNNQHYFQPLSHYKAPPPKTKKFHTAPQWLTSILILACLILGLLMTFHYIIYKTNQTKNSQFLSSFLNSEWTHFKPLSHTPSVEVEITQIESQYPRLTKVTGHVVNYNSYNMPMPIIELTLNKTKTRQKIFYYTPLEYLPYTFRQQHFIKPHQYFDFRIDVPVSNHNFHSIRTHALLTPTSQ